MSVYFPGRLPPSRGPGAAPLEGKADGGTGPPWTPGSISFPELDASRRKVAAALKRTAKQNVAVNAKLLGVKGHALAAARAANRDVLDSPTLPAIERYTGVLYDAFDHATLPAAQRRRAAAQLAIFSGLWGVVTPTDLLPDYKLKMGASLAPMGRLGTFWRPQISAALAPFVEGRTLWDLLPNEHAAAWQPVAGSLRRRISVKFLDEVPDGGGSKLVAGLGVLPSLDRDTLRSPFTLSIFTLTSPLPIRP